MGRFFIFYHNEYYPDKEKYELIHEFDSLEELKEYYLHHYGVNIKYIGGIVGYQLEMYDDCDPINESTSRTAIQIVNYDNFFNQSRLDRMEYRGESQPHIVNWISAYLRDKIIDKILD